MHSFTVLLLVATIAAVCATDCCPYPLSSPSIHIKNVTETDFKCSEPVEFTCELPKDFIGLAVFGNTSATAGQPPQLEDMAQRSLGEPTLTVSAVCHESTGLWSIPESGTISEWSFFKCGVQDVQGWYYIAN